MGLAQFAFSIAHVYQIQNICLGEIRLCHGVGELRLEFLSRMYTYIRNAYADITSHIEVKQCLDEIRLCHWVGEFRLEHRTRIDTYKRYICR